MEQAPAPPETTTTSTRKSRSRSGRITPIRSRSDRSLRSTSIERPIHRNFASSNSLNTSRTNRSVRSVPRATRRRTTSFDNDEEQSNKRALQLEHEKQKIRGEIQQHDASAEDNNNAGDEQEQINGNIKVIIRIRPTLPQSPEASSPLCIDVLPTPPSNNNALTITSRDKKSEEKKTFTFDEILSSSTTQYQLYKNCVLPLIESSLKYGHNSTVFAYGQTGSGKTYTMMGNGKSSGGSGENHPNGNIAISSGISSASSDASPKHYHLPQHELQQQQAPQAQQQQDEEEAEEEEVWKDWGIIPRTLRDIFTRLEQEKKRRVSKSGKQRFHYEIELTCVELYGEKLRDLLTPFQRNPSHVSLSSSMSQLSSGTSPSLKIRESVNGVNGAIETEVVGARTISVSTYEDAMRHIRRSMRTRVVASTNMNDVSSRSHSIATVNITQWRRRKKKKHHHGHHHGDDGSVPASPGIGGGEKEQVDVRECKIHLVDLAGSESLKRTQAEGKRMKEGININKGLTVLGRVISALGRQNSDNKQSLVVPYRDSKLTHLLRGSLGGNHKTLMIACISPSALNQEESLRCLRYASRAKFIENKVETNLSINGHGVDEMTKDEVWGMRLRMKDMESEILTQKNQMEKMAMEMERLKDRNKDLERETEMNKIDYENNNVKMGVISSSNNEEHEGVDMQEFNQFRNRFQEFEREMNTHVDQMKIMASEMLDLERNSRGASTKGHGGLFFNRTLLKVLAQGQTLCPKIVTVMKDVEMQNDAEKAQMMEHTIHETFNLPDDIPPSPPQSLHKDSEEHQQQEHEEEEEEEDGAAALAASETKNKLDTEEMSMLKGELQAMKEERDLLRERLDFQLKKNAAIDDEKYADPHLAGDMDEALNFSASYLKNGASGTSPKRKHKHKKKSVPYTDSDSSALVNGAYNRRDDDKDHPSSAAENSLEPYGATTARHYSSVGNLQYLEATARDRERRSRSKSTDRHRRSKSTSTRQKKRRSRSETRSFRSEYKCG